MVVGGQDGGGSVDQRNFPHKIVKSPSNSVIVIEQQMVNGYPGGQYPLGAYATSKDVFHGPNWLHSKAANFLLLDGSVQKYGINSSFNSQYVIK